MHKCTCIQTINIYATYQISAAAIATEELVTCDACEYGVAATSRLLEMIGLFCKRDPLKRRYSAKETYNFKEPTSRSHPIRSRYSTSYNTDPHIAH